MNSGDPPRGRVLSAWIEGWRRVARAPALVAGVTLALALAAEFPWQPRLPRWAPGGAIGLHVAWIFGNEPFAFGGLANFIQATLAVPPAARALSWDYRMPTGLALTAVATMLLAGGAIDRLARDRRVGPAAFSAATGAFFARFLRLGLLLGGANWIVTRSVGPSLRGLAFAASPDHGSDFLLVAGALLAFVVAFVGDYAQVRAVVEDRHSMLASIGAGWRFIRRRPIATIGLYVMSLVPAVAVGWLLRAAVPPGSGDAVTVTVVRWLDLILAVVVRLAFMATTTAYFQAELAHAGYTARPTPVWPDSPAVEAIAALESPAPARPRRPLPL